jgi:transposase, IS30 family
LECVAPGNYTNTSGATQGLLVTDLSVWTADQLDRVAAELNDRPRLCLGDRTPHQAMKRWTRQQERR